MATYLETFAGLLNCCFRKHFLSFSPSGSDDDDVVDGIDVGSRSTDLESPPPPAEKSQIAAIDTATAKKAKTAPNMSR